VGLCSHRSRPRPARFPYTTLFRSPEADRLEAGGIFNNPEKFRAIVVLQDEDPLHRGCFSAISPGIESDGSLSGIRYGLEDESTRSEEHTSELQSHLNLVCRLLLEK